MHDVSLAEYLAGAFRSSRGQNAPIPVCRKENIFKLTVNDSVYGILQCFSNLFFLAYHCHNTKHVNFPLSAAYINIFFQDTGLTGCFAV